MKKQTFVTLFILLCTALTIQGCANYAQTGALGGAAIGATAGQAIGHNTESTLIGAMVGTTLGYIAGNEQDKFSQNQMRQNYNTSPSGQTSEWQDPDSGTQYAMTPGAAYTYNQRVCRKAIIRTIYSDGRREVVRATACRNPQTGQWELVQ